MIVCVPFPYGVWGRMCNLIVSVDDHCLFIYYERVGLRGMVNNAGMNMHGEMELMTLDLLQNVMDINFYGPVRVMMAFLPLLRK